MRAQFVLGHTDGVDEVRQFLINQRCQAEFLADAFDHVEILARVRGSIFRQRAGLTAFQCINGLASRQVECRSRGGKIQELTRINKGRARRSHMDFLSTVFKQFLNVVLKLRPADDGVFTKKKPLSLD